MNQTPHGYAPRRASLEKQPPPEQKCLLCPTVLTAHSAYITKHRRWEWRFGDDLCYRCRHLRRGGTRKDRLYAVWFPGVKVLKIGHTVQENDALLVTGKNTAAKRKDGKLIWSEDGTVDEEAFMQAYFQLRGYRSWKPAIHRMSEWIYCPDDTIQSLTAKLDNLKIFMQRIKNAEL